MLLTLSRRTLRSLRAKTTTKLGGCLVATSWTSACRRMTQYSPRYVTISGKPETARFPPKHGARSAFDRCATTEAPEAEAPVARTAPTNHRRGELTSGCGRTSASLSIIGDALQ